MTGDATASTGNATAAGGRRVPGNAPAPQNAPASAGARATDSGRRTPPVAHPVAHPVPRPPAHRPVPPRRPVLSELPGPAEPVLDEEKLYAARLHAAQARPYLATALFALRVVESRTVPTMAVDRWWRCYVSARFVQRMPTHELASVWVHEVSHLLRDHHGRGERVTRERGLTGPDIQLRLNIAADCEINDDAYGDGLVQPERAVTPKALGLREGQLMEDYLGQFRLGPYTMDWAWLDCGSGADGAERGWDVGPDGAHGLTAQERDAVRFHVARGIVGQPGNASRGWQRWAQEVVHPPQPWRQLLGAALRTAISSGGAGDDYSYGRPARRSAGLPGVILPSLRRRPPRVTVVVDTSGSVSDDELGSALLELAEITRAVGGRRDLVTVVPCDAAAQAVHALCRAGGIPLLGGGGTDLRWGFTAALGSRPQPDVIVALTDGQTAWPSERPPCRTVIGVFQRTPSWNDGNTGYVPPRPPDWARVVPIGGR